MQPVIMITVAIGVLIATDSARADAVLKNRYVKLAISGTSITSLKAGSGTLDFVKELKPSNWRDTPQTRITVKDNTASIASLEEWREQTYGATGGTDTPVMLTSGHTLGQSFRIPDDVSFKAVSMKLPTWNSDSSGVTISLYQQDVLLVTKKIEKVVNSAWQILELDKPRMGGEYTVVISDPVGTVGWWCSDGDVYPQGGALADGKPVAGDRAIRISGSRLVGHGTLSVSLRQRVISVEASLKPVGDDDFTRLPWRWNTTWTKSGYDCTPKAGIVFSRLFTDNQMYMPVEQLKRRPHMGFGQGCQFTGCQWIEMDGNADADLRLMGDGMGMNWTMTDTVMSMNFDTPMRKDQGEWKSGWRMEVQKRDDTIPAQFPRFGCGDPGLTSELNRFWWERGFTYPAPAQHTIEWADWMGIMRGWFKGPLHDGEANFLTTNPITAEGYVYTYGQTIGWPLVPNRDTRHFDTNARYIIGCWRHYLFTGDANYLRKQQDRLRRAMAYQLDVLKGKEGLIVTPDFKTGWHEDLGDSYWDILPFGHLDAYANIAFYDSLTAMRQIDEALGSTPLADYSTLRQTAHRRYDEVFWDEAKGRYIGCVDIDGARHDYGFTFVNLEAMYCGLGDEAKAKRIYHWMETEPTSSGTADTYSKWIFAPRTTTIHNPMWGENNPNAEISSPVKPWWTYWWPGTPFGDQCQDGGAILYTSFYDLMARVKYLGVENAWTRFSEIMARYRMPDRLCGGSPLYRGETSQQEDAGSVGVDYPFPESGLVPLYFLYGVIGLEATPDSLQVTPKLPAKLSYAEVSNIDWRGMSLRVRVTRSSVEFKGKDAQGKPYSKRISIKPGGCAVLKVDSITHVPVAVKAPRL